MVQSDTIDDLIVTSTSWSTDFALYPHPCNLFGILHHSDSATDLILIVCHCDLFLWFTTL